MFDSAPVVGMNLRGFHVKHFCLVGDGISLGRDIASPVRPDYADRGTFAFIGGRINKVIIDVTGEGCVDHEAQVRARLLTD